MAMKPVHIPTKSLHNGFTIPVYGMGTWRMGGDMTHDLANDDAADVSALQAAIDSGVTHIDTAEKYAEGYAETLVGKAITGRPRDELFLVSKLSSAHAAHDDVQKSVVASLSRMNIDYLDLYLLHSYSGNEVPLEETLHAMDALVTQGLVRAIGVSNFGTKNLARAQSIARNPIVVNQVHYNLQVREVEQDGLLEYCQENDVMLMAWRPLQFDALTHDASGACETPDMHVLDEICAKYDKSRAQVAPQWLIAQRNVVTISKTRSIAHLQENLDACDWEMEADDVERLRKEFPAQLTVSDIVPLDS